MLRLKLVFAAAALMAGAAFASPTAPKNGAEYTTLKTPQPVQAEGKKVEVIEFFMYHCPACYALEPAMLEWVKMFQAPTPEEMALFDEPMLVHPDTRGNATEAFDR